MQQSITLSVLEMLGIRSDHSPLKGKEAMKVMSKLVRVQTNNLNEEDKKELASIKAFNKKYKGGVTIVWR